MADLDVSLEMLVYGDVQWCRWLAKLSTGGVEIARLHLFQTFPQRVVDGIGQIWIPENNPYIPRIGQQLGFRPATYAEGGSPYG
jgi:hypothetical protein